MLKWLLALVLFLGLIGPANAYEKQTSDEAVRRAVERSLPFLLEGGEAWREGRAGGGQNKRVCVTCHQIPFTIWSHNEAHRKGIKFDQKRLDDLTTWSLDWCAAQKHPKTQTHTGGFLSTMQQMVMGRSSEEPEGKTLETYELFGKVIGSMQKEEGWWKEGNQIRGKATEREANEVDTMWVVLGLQSLEQLKLPGPALAAAARDRQRALAWLG
jgi:hypothetical protein